MPKCASGVSRHLLQNAVMVPNNLLASSRHYLEFEWVQCRGVVAMAAIDLRRSRQYDHKWTGGVRPSVIPPAFFSAQLDTFVTKCRTWSHLRFPVFVFKKSQSGFRMTHGLSC